MPKKQYNILDIFEKFIIAMFIIALIKIICNNNPDNDFWWLAATGRWIVKHRAVPKINPFTWHENFEIIVQQWLPCVLNYITYQKAGIVGNVLFSAAMYILAVYLAWKYISCFRAPKFTKKCALGIAALYLLTIATARPSIGTASILLGEIILLKKFDGSKDCKYLLGLPILSFVLINWHASLWWMSIIFILPYAVPSIYKFRKGKFKNALLARMPYFTCIPAMFLMALINPNGIKSIMYLPLSYGAASYGNVIMEMISPKMLSIWGIVIIAVLILTALYLHREKEHSNFPAVYFAVGCAVLAANNLRNQWLLGLGMIPIVLLYFQKDIKPFMIKKRLSVIISVYLSLIVIYFAATANITLSAETDSTYTPVAASDYLDNYQGEMKIYNSFDNGGYLEWRGIPVYLDARPELYEMKINTKENIYSEFVNVHLNLTGIGQLISKYQFTHVLAETNSVIDRDVSGNADYEIVAIGNGYRLYERK